MSELVTHLAVFAAIEQTPAILLCVAEPSPGTTGSSNFETFVDPVDGTRWSIDVDFIDSNWTCIWNKGCEGILDQPSANLNQGCCSVGAQMIDEDEALRIAALGLTVDPSMFQYAEAALDGGVFSDDSRSNTRVIDGACIFHNRPGFSGGEGCALHLAAEEDGENPVEYKPSICWQAPLKVDHHDDGSKTLRPWKRHDWDSGLEAMAWCCTNQGGADEALASAFVGDVHVGESLHAELRGLVGPEIAVQLRDRSTR